MEQYAVETVEMEKIVNKDIILNVPGSKSITNRALLLAVIAGGKSTLTNVLFSDDSRHFMECVKALGFEVDVDEERREVQIAGNALRCV